VTTCTPTQLISEADLCIPIPLLAKGVRRGRAVSPHPGEMPATTELPLGTGPWAPGPDLYGQETSPCHDRWSLCEATELPRKTC